MSRMMYTNIRFDLRNLEMRYPDDEMAVTP